MVNYPPLLQIYFEISKFLISGAGSEFNVLDRFKRLFGGYVVPTYFGQTYMIEVKQDPNSLAYTSAGLLPHNDVASLRNNPDITALHCMQQFEGIMRPAR